MVEEQSRSHLAPVALVIAVVLASVVAALGGLRESPTRMPRQLAPGQSVDTAQWRVRPLRAWIGDRCPLAPAGLPAPREPCLSLEVELTNLTRASSNDIADALTFVDPRLPPAAPPELMLARDRGLLFQLHAPQHDDGGGQLTAARTRVRFRGGPSTVRVPSTVSVVASMPARQIFAARPIRFPSGSRNCPMTSGPPGDCSGPRTRVPPSSSTRRRAAWTSGTWT